MRAVCTEGVLTNEVPNEAQELERWRHVGRAVPRDSSRYLGVFSFSATGVKQLVRFRKKERGWVANRVQKEAGDGTRAGSTGEWFLCLPHSKERGGDGGVSCVSEQSTKLQDIR